MAKQRVLKIKAPRSARPQSDEAKVALLEQGAQGAFWGLLCDYLDEMIDEANTVMTEGDMASLPAEEYKLMNENLKFRIQYLETLKNAPSACAERLRPGPQGDDADMEEDED